MPYTQFGTNPMKTPKDLGLGFLANFLFKIRLVFYIKGFPYVFETRLYFDDLRFREKSFFFEKISDSERESPIL